MEVIIRDVKKVKSGFIVSFKGKIKSVNNGVAGTDTIELIGFLNTNKKLEKVFIREDENNGYDADNMCVLASMFNFKNELEFWDLDETNPILSITDWDNNIFAYIADTTVFLCSYGAGTNHPIAILEFNSNRNIFPSYNLTDADSCANEYFELIYPSKVRKMERIKSDKEERVTIIKYKIITALLSVFGILVTVVGVWYEIFKFKLFLKFLGI